MKKMMSVGITLLSVLLLSACMAEDVNTSAPLAEKMVRFQSVAMDEATLVQTGEHKEACPLCGMKLPMFYKTNHVATSNGTVKQYCSLHCLVDDKMNHESNLTDMKVVAVDTLKFIDVKDATYVVGSDVKGTMSGISKYAFSGRMSAQRFAQEHQGQIMSFDEAYAYAKKDFQ